ncbi:MAG TPA: UbiA family prenyltransferase [Syntrophobacteria bacterium]|jgi:4-hydroxybenzoate polyprenyltransferase|nr:UbiA family prenyltransferase [Syntrophobacteria bacterium]
MERRDGDYHLPAATDGGKGLHLPSTWQGLAFAADKDRPLPQAPAAPPLAVDLDGTLVKTDLFMESLVALLRRNLLYLAMVPLWLLKGRANLKRQVSRRCTLDVSLLPYQPRLVDYLKAQRERGRRLVLATGADELLAHQVADHLHLFDLVVSSNGIQNLSPRQKRDRLVEEFGEQGFDYAGNERGDLIVWRSARKAVVVRPKLGARRAAERIARVDEIFDDDREPLLSYLRALRLHQWLKNLLVFVPLLAAHRVSEFALTGRALLAVLAFGLCASSGYLLNDLADLPSDRRHPRKRRRPFASGEISLLSGLFLIPALLAMSALLGLLLPPLFLAMLGIYYGVSLAYSLALKRHALFDVIVLAGLYALRVAAGSAAVQIWPSPWLLAFSIFLFLSLALVKRYAELVAIAGTAGESATARGYQPGDGELLAAMGTASGYVAVLVLAIYIASGTAQLLYSRHEFIWLLCPLLLYWISYVWLMAHRGKMNDDPLVFALRDRASWIVLLLAALTLLLAV